jgi:hypothetical protein
MPPNAVIGTCSGLFLASDFDGPHQPFKGDPDQPLFAAGAKGTNRKHVLINYG